MSILLWITTKMEYKIKYYNRSLLLPRVVINSTIKGLIINLKKKKMTLVPVYKLLSYVHLIARQAKSVIRFKFQLVLGLKVS